MIEHQEIISLEIIKGTVACILYAHFFSSVGRDSNGAEKVCAICH